ncbi:hypothetical protein O181_051226 [Austropuccinia psidii MF-1]|uniref:Uncharacterized protein n=1 Tax=Austropuccinia psidii MF-1 TaxID=1389203 RepID=A0A9Q3HN50_9BASI|nr:hypothetical protein [Austropuccinia psidii MF-1]
METKDHTDKSDEYYCEKDPEESETSEGDETNVINAQINNIDLIYEVMDMNSNLPQIEISNKSLTHIQDAKIHGMKPAKGM